MDLLSLVITIVSGIIGGNLTGLGLKDKSLGPAGNSVTGAVGGGAGNWILHLLGVLASAGTTALQRELCRFPALKVSISALF